MSVPRIFNPSNRDALRADAKTFNFTAIENGRHFYKLGMHLSRSGWVCLKGESEMVEPDLVS